MSQQAKGKYFDFKRETTDSLTVKPTLTLSQDDLEKPMEMICKTGW